MCATEIRQAPCERNRPEKGKHVGTALNNMFQGMEWLSQEEKKNKKCDASH